MANMQVLAGAKAASRLPAWRAPQWRDSGPTLSIQRRTAWALGVTLLLHSLLFLLLVKHKMPTGEQAAQTEPHPIYLQLNPLPQEGEKAAEPAETPAPTTPVSKQAARTPTPRPAITKPLKPTDTIVPIEDISALLQPEQAKPPVETASGDMMAQVNANRERRRATERIGADPADEARPSADEIRMANIRRNLQPPGTNGVFQILSKGYRTAQFSFRGWSGNYSNTQRELIDVDAGPGGDVERAIVQRMIALIRKYYKGDFNWESQRLGRTVVLSARLEDNEGLEAFLLREFFGAGRGAPP
ncbi:hypothetical protein FNU76_12645 [Chitinimonas arctica]|uniref:Uncharacterized protein n=2 Tax=Chitinimonas arctica TaxID=2594795 RepID=A0A516SG52_9NEIS|nr:hypothetical protein FNU76_12645 [Chitinimonas arctica]